MTRKMPNFWSINKTTSLKVLLLRWQALADNDSWLLAQPDDLDEQSMRLQAADQPALAAYVAIHGEAPGRYTLHLEYPAFEGANISDSVSMRQNLALEQVLELLQMHLG